MSTRFWIGMGIAVATPVLLTSIAMIWSRVRARREAARLRDRSPKDTIELKVHGQDMRKTDHWNLS